jgi:hypothetical protein
MRVDRPPASSAMLRSHIQESQLKVREITLHRLHEAQQAGGFVDPA